MLTNYTYIDIIYITESICYIGGNFVIRELTSIEAIELDAKLPLIANNQAADCKPMANISLSQMERVEFLSEPSEVRNSGEGRTYPKTAFTLSEVLITLGIIGVVAALTITPLIKNYQRKETAIRLKKSYNELSQAIKLSEIENLSATAWDYSLDGHRFVEKYLKKYIKYTNEYSSIELSKVAPRKNLNGSNYGGTTYTYPTATHIMLTNGTLVTINCHSPSEAALWVGLDINGLKKPNKIGIDTFLFMFSAKYGLQPLGGMGTGTAWSYGQYDRSKVLSSSYGDACNKNRTGYWCSAVIMNDNWEIAPDYPR